jgi:hypothetical protein
MPFMPPTDDSDRIWERDGLEIYVVKEKGKVFVKIRAPGRPKEREWRVVEGHYTRYGVEASFERVPEDEKA